MTDRDDDTKSELDRPIEELIGQALAGSGALIPTTEAEVACAESAGVQDEVELPHSIREYHGAASQPARVIPIENARRASSPRAVWLGHGVAALVGAAAALCLVWWHGARTLALAPNLERDPRQQSIGAGNPRPNESGPLAVKLDDTCSAQCCAGIDCESAKDKPKECASGRRCVRCVENDSSGERYRIRTGRIAPTQALVRLLEATPDKVLDVCFRVNAIASGDFACTAAQAKGGLDEAWELLSLVVSGVDLLTGLTVQLRWRGEATPIGEWSSPIQTATAVFCSGLSIKPKQSDGEQLGTLSVFLDDAYYVELGRDRDPNALVRMVGAYRFTGTTPKLYETSADGDGHFAATIGPMSKAAAESARWTLLEHGSKARLVVGLDYRGEPKLVR